MCLLDYSQGALFSVALKLFKDTVDGSEIPNNNLDVKQTCKQLDKLPTSTDDRRISEASTVWVLFKDTPSEN